MSNGNDPNTNFGRSDGVDLKTYLCDRLEAVFTLINERDKNYNQRFDNVVEATKSALAAADRAVNKAEMATEKRFEGVNEFRNTLSDQQRTFISRTELDVMFESINDKIDLLETNSISKQSQGVGLKEGWGWAVGLIGIVIALVVFFSRFI